MTNKEITSIKNIFNTRLDTLTHLLDTAEKHYGNNIETLLQKRIISDMATFGTQIAFICNQPRNFSLWCMGKEIENLNPEVKTLELGRSYISSTKELLNNLDVEDSKLEEIKIIDFKNGIVIEVPGSIYVQDFLMPNFYFHFVTAYDIMRMDGVQIGKADYMRHLMPYIKKTN